MSQQAVSIAKLSSGGAINQAAHLCRAFGCTVRALVAVRCQVNAAISIRLIAGLFGKARAATAAVLTAYAAHCLPY